MRGRPPWHSQKEWGKPRASPDLNELRGFCVAADLRSLGRALAARHQAFRRRSSSGASGPTGATVCVSAMTTNRTRGCWPRTLR